MAVSRPAQIMAKFKNSADPSTIADQPVTLFLCGDVMTGRGIDQVLPHPGDPAIHESYMKSAQGYVHLAERVNGPIRKPVEFDWIWGDALEVLRQVAPDLRIINLETSITVSNDFWPAPEAWTPTLARDASVSASPPYPQSNTWLLASAQQSMAAAVIQGVLAGCMR